MLSDADKEEYKLALRVGKKRFGSSCQHKVTRNGVCVSCLRKVVTTNAVKKQRDEIARLKEELKNIQN